MNWILIFLAGLITYFLRYSMISFIKKDMLNEKTKTLLGYVPSAVFPALIFPAVLLDNSASFVSYNDPKILILINIICIFSSSLLVYFLSKKIFGSFERNNYISFNIAILFLINPIIFKGYFYQPYGFQPDTLATPFFLGIFILLW